MKQVISSQKKPIKMWLDNLEHGAIQQAKNLANLPFLFKHVAIMPDSHQGYGMPIGGVLATEGVVIPNAVGVDIGCGMCSVKTSIKTEEIDKIDFSKLMNLIRKKVPVGFNHHQRNQNSKWMPDGMDDVPKTGNIRKELSSALKQVGTLGGGNHFIEIQAGDDGYVWIMIHSGSRNLGYKTARHHNTLAKEINKKYWSEVPPSWDLAFLLIDSQEGQDYISELNYATKFALANRAHMMEAVKECLIDVAGWGVTFDPMINKPHNFAEMEHHFGKNVMVHRKGACRARNGEVGMIPGSQGTHSYIVKGKGEENSFQSCSHGAGRVMGRKAAQRSLDFDTEVKRLNDMGVYHTLETVKQLDEAAGAYKDIDLVMENQSDLVEILVKLKPLAVVKA
jgi:tRNA-splicing ligase RtcB (3'-phosphate/5'-hydroxy nucleic acid ligase)